MKDEPKLTFTSAEVLASARWNSIGQTIAQFLRFMSFIVLAHFLTPDEYGIVSMALVVIGLLSLFQNMGTTAAIIQNQNLTQKLLNSVYWFNISIGFALGAALWLGSGSTAALFSESRLDPVLEFIALGFVVSGFGAVPRALLHRRLKFAHVATIEVSTVTIYVALALYLAWKGYGVWSIVIASVVQSAASSAAVILGAAWKPQLQFSWKEIRSIFAFSANLTAFEIINYLLVNSDRLIVGRYLGAGALGVYDLANRLAGHIVKTLLPALLRVLFPAMSRMADEDDRLSRALLRAIPGVVLVLSPMVAGMAAISDVFVEVALDPKWNAVAIIVPILAIRHLLKLVLNSASVIYRVKARADLLLYWGIGSGLVLLLSYYVGSHWGLVGVATAQSAAMCLLAYPAMRIPLSLIGMPVRKVVLVLIPHALACVTMVVAVRVFLISGERLALGGTMQLIGAIAVGAVVYGLAVYLLRARGIEDFFRLIPGRRS